MVEPLAQAYYLKDELRQFWQQSSKAAAAKLLDASGDPFELRDNLLLR